MMIGEHYHHRFPTIQIPQYPQTKLDKIEKILFPFSNHTLSPNDDNLAAALHRFLPCNDAFSGETDPDLDDFDQTPLVDAYSCDEFRMYEFKVRRCSRGRSHDWTECPYAHPGEKARRRDPRKYHYSGTACPEFRKGSCKRGDSCEFAHGVFECWLHPARYRTQPCKDGVGCRRRVCFFAHTPEQLRVVAQSPRSPAGCDSYDGSPMRRFFPRSPTSTLVSPEEAVGSPTVEEVMEKMRKLRVWNETVGSPAVVAGGWLPATRGGAGNIMAKLSEKFALEGEFEEAENGSSNVVVAAPDISWVSDLLK